MSAAELPEPVARRIAAGAFLLLDKPRGPTSHQVTAWARDRLGVPTAGHAGTLDPNVSGLLWIGVGPALKLLPLLLDFPKRYIGAIAWHGNTTPAELQRVIAEFTGPIYQTPPVRSAVLRERRIRTVHRLTLVEHHGVRSLVDVVADSGTYIRTLAVDLGEATGVGAHLAELRRTGVGPFTETSSVPMVTLSDAVAEAQQGRADALLALLHPIDEVTREFPQIVLKPGAASAIVHGAGLASGGIRSVSRSFHKGAHVILVAPEGETLAIGRAERASDELRGGTGWVVSLVRVLVDPSRYPTVWRPTTRPPSPASPSP